MLLRYYLFLSSANLASDMAKPEGGARMAERHSTWTVRLAVQPVGFAISGALVG